MAGPVVYFRLYYFVTSRPTVIQYHFISLGVCFTRVVMMTFVAIFSFMLNYHIKYGNICINMHTYIYMWICSSFFVFCCRFYLQSFFI